MAGPLAPKLALARAVGRLSRLRGGGASSAPGKVLLRLDPGAIGTLGARLRRGSVLVSATNGKTTTTAFLVEILKRADVSLVSNQTGANMAGGIASSLLTAARSGGSIAGELGLFEVDELWLDSVASQLHPRAILLGNLFRDQLDRYGELETIADRWDAAVNRMPTHPARESMLVLNADDPAIADLGRSRDAPVLYFGIEDDSLALPGMAHAADAKHCRNCGAPYVFDAIYLGHLGHYHCPNCGQARPAPTVIATNVTLQGVRAAHFTLTTPAGVAKVELSLPGLYNVYNALAAAALASALEVGLAEIVAGLQSTKAAFGRAESVWLRLDPEPARHAAGGPRLDQPPLVGPHLDGAPGSDRRELQILLVKNPAGANEVLRTLALEPGEHDLLGVLNDKIADGRDISWIWDADFELLAGRIRRATCSGTRAPELALRLKYAGVDPARIRVQAHLPTALREASEERAGSEPAAPLYALPTYTAMLALRELLVARGEASSAWS